MSTKVVVVDYGVGNLRSVCHAFEHCGAKVTLSDGPRSILDADRLVLPGVGAVAHCLDELRDRGLMDPLRQFADTGRPFLGICVGMQLMFDVSLEFGEHQCFDWISGRVVEIPRMGANGRRRIPHIAWAPLQSPQASNGWEESILRGIPNGSRVYFVHSFMAQPDDPGSRLADTNYDGVTICAAVESGPMTGTQFHPEKSGTVGLQIIRNFLDS